MNENVALIYRVASDSGLAPCVHDDLLTLACCKGGWKTGVRTGIRYWVGAEKKGYSWKEDNVYVIGIYKDKLLYIAKITDAKKMIDYYSCDDYRQRADFIYKVVGSDKLERNDKYPCIHSDKSQYIRDVSGVYVLFSNECRYFGKNPICIPEGLHKYIPRGRGTRTVRNLSDSLVCELMNSTENTSVEPHDPIWNMCAECKEDCKFKTRRCSR